MSTEWAYDETPIFLTKMGKKIINKQPIIMRAYTLNPLSVWDNDAKVAWVELAAGKHAFSWGNIKEWSLLTRRQLLSRVVGLRIETDEGEKNDVQGMAWTKAQH